MSCRNAKPEIGETASIILYMSYPRSTFTRHNLPLPCPRAYPSPSCNSRLSCRDNLRSCQHWQGRPRNNLYGRNVIISMRRYPAELSQPRTEPTLKLLPGSNVKTLFVLQLNCSITRDDAEVEGTVVGRSHWLIGSKLYSCVWRVK